MKKTIGYILLGVIAIVIITIIAFRLISKPNNNDKKNDPPKSYIYTDINKKITITGSNEYDLDQNSNADYILDLSGKNSFRLLVSKIDNVESKTLNVVANADKELYIKNYNEVTDVSETTIVTIDNKESFKYSFKYFDTTFDKSLIMNIYYVRVDDTTYVIDIIHPAETETNYNDEIDYLLSNTKFGE